MRSVFSSSVRCSEFYVRFGNFWVVVERLFRLQLGVVRFGAF